MCTVWKHSLSIRKLLAISLGRKWEVGILAGREDSGIESAVGRNSHNDRHGHMNLR